MKSFRGLSFVFGVFAIIYFAVQAASAQVNLGSKWQMGIESGGIGFTTQKSPQKIDPQFERDLKVTISDMRKDRALPGNVVTTERNETESFVIPFNREESKKMGVGIYDDLMSVLEKKFEMDKEFKLLNKAGVYSEMIRRWKNAPNDHISYSFDPTQNLLKVKIKTESKSKEFNILTDQVDPITKLIPTKDGRLYVLTAGKKLKALHINENGGAEWQLLAKNVSAVYGSEKDSDLAVFSRKDSKFIVFKNPQLIEENRVLGTGISHYTKEYDNSNQGYETKIDVEEGIASVTRTKEGDFKLYTMKHISGGSLVRSVKLNSTVLETEKTAEKSAQPTIAPRTAVSGQQ